MKRLTWFFACLMSYCLHRIEQQQNYVERDACYSILLGFHRSKLQRLRCIYKWYVEHFITWPRKFDDIFQAFKIQWMTRAGNRSPIFHTPERRSIRPLAYYDHHQWTRTTEFVTQLSYIMFNWWVSIQESKSSGSGSVPKSTSPKYYLDNQFVFL